MRADGSTKSKDGSFSGPAPIDAVVVTGAGRGIGRAVALALGNKRICVLCISKTSNCERTRREIEHQGGVAESLVLDLSDYREAERRVSEWAAGHHFQRYGAVLAAAVIGPAGPLQTTDLSGWEEVLRVNLLGNLAVLRGLIGPMIQNAFGRIIFFSGGGAAYGYPELPAYAASKTAAVRTVENLHEDLQARGDFSVVCLAPGAVETDLLKEVRAAGAEVKTVGAMEDVVEFVETFLTNGSKRLSGRFIHVRDSWASVMENELPLPDDHWKLRRVQ